VQVEEHEIGSVGANSFEALVRGAELLDGVAGGGQDPLEEAPDLGVIVDDEDAGQGGFGSLCPRARECRFDPKIIADRDFSFGCD